MRIGFLTTEYPSLINRGGIATYVRQAATMLVRRGHEAVVYTSSGLDEVAPFLDDGVEVIPIVSKDGGEFRAKIAAVLRPMMVSRPLDVLEVPEIGHFFSEARHEFPALPVVVKLHTPSFLIGEINRQYARPFFTDQIRTKIAILRGRLKPPPTYDHTKDPEAIATRDADEIAAPSIGIKNLLAKRWALPEERISHFPYPYIPTQELLAIDAATHPNVLTFFGRLELRKGIHFLIDALPKILIRHPQLRVRFVGADMPSTRGKLTMKDYVRLRLAPFGDRVSIEEPIAPAEIPKLLAETGISVLPSIFENFSLVCLESMAAGRAVIASHNGGMGEMMGNNERGIAIPPADAEAIVRAVGELLENPARMAQYGKAARKWILDELNEDRICALQLQSYQRAIDRRRK